ncbi:MAG: ATPase [Chloroflexi bacterium]|nr:ATPase [Chloroflexota bacterium]
MTRYFLGVDVGGTKTYAMIADERGQVVGLGKAGTGNHEAVGYDGLRKVLLDSTAQALDAARITIDQIAGAGFGIAGYDWPSERQLTLDAIGVLGLQCPLEAVNDMVVGLIAGAHKGWGIVIDAGTGTNCRGRTPDGREGMVTGMGSIFGEYGGAYDLVHRALCAVAYEWSKRGPATRLSQEFLRLTGAADLTDLLEGLTMGTYELSGTAAPLVFKVAAEGDPVALEVITWLGNELGESINAVVRQLEIEDQEFDVVMIGSLFKGGPLLVDPMIRKVHSIAPGAQFYPLEAPPVAGGIMLGMEMAGVDYQPIRQRLLESAQAACE